MYNRLKHLLRAVAVLRSGTRIYSPVAYAFGMLLPVPAASPGPVAWLRGLPRPQLTGYVRHITLGHVGLYPGVKLHCTKAGTITIGDGSYANRHTRLYAGATIQIGHNTMLSWDTILTTTTPDGSHAPITIGDHVWIGSRVIIMGGTTLRTGTRIAAGAIVHGTYPADAVLVGKAAEIAA